MTNKELYDLTKYLFEAWERSADYDNYHMDCQYVLEGLVKPEEQQSCDKQEPVIWTKTWFEDGKVVTQHLTAKDIYREPDEEEYLSKAYRLANELRCHLAIAPAPQRKPLTDEEIETIAARTLFPVNFARAIEAKLKENT